MALSKLSVRLKFTATLATVVIWWFDYRRCTNHYRSCQSCIIYLRIEKLNSILEVDKIVTFNSHWWSILYGSNLQAQETIMMQSVKLVAAGY